MNTSPTKSPLSLNLALWLGYVAFVVYGSLVPLDFRALPIEQAWSIFQRIPMLTLGVESRADWIANGVLYLPVGFLTVHLLIQQFPAKARPLLLVLAGLFSFILAGAVEFAQIFFPPRTVSLNDLLAENLGSLIGLLLATSYSARLKTLLHALFFMPNRLLLHLFEAYFIVYVAFSLFPYDILISGDELAHKLNSSDWGWLLAGEARGGYLLALKLASEILMTLPIGLYLGYRSLSAARRPATFGQTILLGVLLGTLLEIAQFFIATGVSQGVSVLTRTAGICAGLALWKNRARGSPERTGDFLRRHALLLGSIYVPALLLANGWFMTSWRGIDYAVDQLNELHFLPFYYHYFTSEANALVSLVFVCLTYLPVGLQTLAMRGKPRHAFFLACFAALIVETGKLFLQGMRPDPTNILIGSLTAWGVVSLGRKLILATPSSAPGDKETERAPHRARDETTTTGMQPPGIVQDLHPHPGAEYQPVKAQRHVVPATSTGNRNRTALLFLIPALAFAAYWAATFPTQPLALFLLLAVCAAVSWHRPLLIVAIIPAALPILDLAPWSGRFYLDEFDLLLLISLAIGYARVRPVTRASLGSSAAFTLAWWLLGLSFIASACIALIPWKTPEANSFISYYSSFNALRIAKGVLWAWLGYGLLRRMAASGMNVQRTFMHGMTAGLGFTVAVVFWERIAFSGLFNFGSDYRITGPFSAMHTGGAYIECFLAVAVPYLTILIIKSRNGLVRIAGSVFMLATCYALMVTFSRNGYLAFGISLFIILFFTTFKSGHWPKRLLFAATLTAAMVAVSIPIFTGKFAQSRMARVDKDLVVRQKHWEDALDIRTPGWLTTLLGMGLGRFPESHYLLSREGGQSGTYQLKSEEDNTYLRLVSGNSIYFEQLVSVAPRQTYLLSLDVRASRPNVNITTPICEKWLLTSYNCNWKTMSIGKEAGVWRRLEARINTDQLIQSPWYSRRPIKFSLYNSNSRTTLDIDNVRLETLYGENLLRNSDFSQGIDHWFFSADSHLQWHAKSLPVAVLFDQGWFGLFAFGLFSLVGIWRGTRLAWQGNLHAAAALAAFIGFLVVGLFDTLIDAPRFLFLFLLLGVFCSLDKTPTAGISIKNAMRNG